MSQVKCARGIDPRRAPRRSRRTETVPVALYSRTTRATCEYPRGRGLTVRATRTPNQLACLVAMYEMLQPLTS